MLFASKVLYNLSLLWYNLICKIRLMYQLWNSIQHNVDYVIRRRFWRIFYFYAKLSSACFPFFCGVPYRWKWYKFELCWYCCDQECPQALQYLFRYRKMCVQTGGEDYAETPFADLHLHLCTRLSSPAKCSCGLRVCRFSLQKSYRILFLALLHSGVIFVSVLSR